MVWTGEIFMHWQESYLEFIPQRWKRNQNQNNVNVGT